MQKYIIIVAGGSGIRMNSSVPKQFIELKGRPVLMHTIEKFYKTFQNIHIVVVLASQLNDQWKQLCLKHNFKINHQLVDGGSTRFHSVKNGLNSVPENCIVGVHDAARPLISEETINRTFAVAEKLGNAIPCIPIAESIREINDSENKAVDRSKFVIIQTPQCFQSTLLKEAFLQSYNDSFTDDASVLEANGEKINLVDGNKENIKITTSQDLIIAEALLKGFAS